MKTKETKSIVKPKWLKISEEELKKLIVQLSEKNQSAQIGLILRDQYGIPTVKVYGKKLGDYLKELDIKRNPDKENAEKKIERLKDHFKKNMTDKKAKHKIQKAQGRANNQKKYAEKRKSEIDS